MLLKMLGFFAASSCFAWLLLFAGFQTKRDVRRQEETEHTRTTGTVIEYVRRETRAGRNHWHWVPVVEFIADGQRVRAEYVNSMDRERFPEGTDVDVLYNLSDPLQFHLAEDPVFTDPGSGAIRISAIWILASAALTILLAVLVGGLSIDFEMLLYRIRRLFSPR